MNTVDDFVALVCDEVGIQIAAEDLDTGFDQVPGWDSVHLLTLMMALERSTGRRVSMPDLLEAQSLGHVYRLAVGS
ncbi:acyl carrier protein [Streptomyces sp. NPDC006617]|uniref:acyl carrier protein n=1 Tax=Streptomyces sp. NPDC006617 TaxID=3155354 RepID=UPI0033BAA0EE